MHFELEKWWRIGFFENNVVLKSRQKWYEQIPIVEWKVDEHFHYTQYDVEWHYQQIIVLKYTKNYQGDSTKGEKRIFLDLNLEKIRKIEKNPK
jgi:hypothetical protein